MVPDKKGNSTFSSERNERLSLSKLIESKDKKKPKVLHFR